MVHLFSSSVLSGTTVKLVVSIKNLDKGEPRQRQAWEPPRGRLPRAATDASDNFPLTNFVGEEERRRRRRRSRSALSCCREPPIHARTSPPPSPRPPSCERPLTNFVAKNAVWRGASS